MSPPLGRVVARVAEPVQHGSAGVVVVSNCKGALLAELVDRSSRSLCVSVPALGVETIEWRNHRSVARHRRDWERVGGEFGGVMSQSRCHRVCVSRPARCRWRTVVASGASSPSTRRTVRSQADTRVADSWRRFVPCGRGSRRSPDAVTARCDDRGTSPWGGCDAKRRISAIWSPPGRSPAPRTPSGALTIGWWGSRSVAVGWARSKGSVLVIGPRPVGFGRRPCPVPGV